VPDLGIGVIGAGWVVRECHLPAYRAAGINGVGIASRQMTRAGEVAAEFGVGRVARSWQELLDDSGVEILHIADRDRSTAGDHPRGDKASAH
jgi:predicted dehydrogenase